MTEEEEKEEETTSKSEIHYKKLSLDGISAVFLSSSDISSSRLIPLIADISPEKDSVNWYCLAKNESCGEILHNKRLVMVLEDYRAIREDVLESLQEVENKPISYSLSSYQGINDSFESLATIVSSCIKLLSLYKEDHKELIELLEQQLEDVKSRGLKSNSESTLKLNQDIDGKILQIGERMESIEKTKDRSKGGTEEKTSGKVTVADKVKSKISSIFTSFSSKYDAENFIDSNKEMLHVSFAYDRKMNMLKLARSSKGKRTLLRLNWSLNGYNWDFTYKPEIYIKQKDFGVIMPVLLKKRMEEMIDPELVLPSEQVEKILDQELDNAILENLSPLISEELLEMKDFFIILLNFTN
ncbi:MAG: hypothetical protein ACFFD4_30300 [Candidatus Odinarchaeota archaeon]